MGNMNSSSAWALLAFIFTAQGRGGGPVRGFLLLKSAMKACVRSIAGTAVRIAGSSLLRSSVMVTPRCRTN